MPLDNGSATLPTPPPGITLVKGRDRSQIRMPFSLARWYRNALWIAVPAMVVQAPLVVAFLLVLVHRDAVSWRLIAVGLAIAASVFLTFTFCWLALLSVFFKPSVTIDAESIYLSHAPNFFRIPIKDIHNIQFVQHSTRTRLIDPTRPLSHFLRRFPIVSLDVDLPLGRLRTFQELDQSRLRWLADAIPILIDLSHPRAPVPDSPTVTATASLMDRQTRRLLLAIAFIVSLLCLALPAWYIIPGLASRSWPTTTGTVTHSLYEEPHGRQKLPTAELTYSYSINNHPYTGTRIGFARDTRDDTVRSLVVSHPPGSTLPVYYDPANPARSTLIPGPAADLWIWTGFGLLAVALASPLYLRRPPTAAHYHLASHYAITKAESDALNTFAPR